MLTLQCPRLEITDDDNEPLQDLVNRKDVTGLKVLIAIGGWDFSCVVAVSDFIPAWWLTKCV
jgi:hypothetical protein